MFRFTLEKTIATGARAGNFVTPHGVVQTPIFMPVGTLATVKALDSQDIERLDAQIILANTYHLYLRPGMDHLEAAGGIHSFMNWSKPVLTDSGGFQVFSLGDNTRITEDGVEFKSHLDGSKHFFTPTHSIEIQRQIGADIIMAFDQCTLDKASMEEAMAALDRTHRWAEECVQYWQEQGRMSKYGKYQALFGIIQGAMHQDLRRLSAQTIVSKPFDGIAVGGETIGYNMPGTVEVMSWLKNILPEDKPRYAMGLGLDPQNLLDAVQAGFDMFDCVAPTRLARNGALYTGQMEMKDGAFFFETELKKGRLNIGNAKYRLDQKPIQEGCDCFTCQSGYSRSYLHHLFHTQELAYYRLASIHNVRFMVRLSQELRAAILRG